MGKTYERLQLQLKDGKYRKNAEECLKIYDKLKEISNGSVWSRDWEILVTVSFLGEYPNTIRRYRPTKIGYLFLKGIEVDETKKLQEEERQQKKLVVAVAEEIVLGDTGLKREDVRNIITQEGYDITQLREQTKRYIKQEMDISEPIFNEFLVNKKINKKINIYKYHPTSKGELIHNIIELLNDNIYDLNCIDASNITDMSNLFDDIKNKIKMPLYDEKINISDWDVSNVEDMSDMFYECAKFNCDISNWNVSNVTNMSNMFNGCHNFNQSLNDWDVSNVRNMSCMFEFCHNFNKTLNKWNVSNVEDTSYMFCQCTKFNQDLSNWDVSKVKDMTNMFYKCDSLKNKPTWYKE